jgi:cytochrome c-type biogenesis protein CcmF
LGAVFMVLGGGLAAFDRRYRQAPSAARAPGAQADMGMGLGASGVRGAAPAAMAKGSVS